MLPMTPRCGRPSFTAGGCPHQGLRSLLPPSTASTSSLLCWMTLLNVCLLVGCGSGVEPKVMGTVSGKVTLGDKALTIGRVAFVSSTVGASSFGDLKEGGTYTLGGPIPVGEYRVFITPPDLGDTPAGLESEQPQDELKDVPEKYLDEATTDLKATVKEGENTCDFDLKP